MRKFIAGAAAAAMVVGSSVAQAAPVAFEDVRSASPVGESEQAVRTTHFVLGGLAFAILFFILWQINEDGENKNLPTSP